MESILVGCLYYWHIKESVLQLCPETKQAVIKTFIVNIYLILQNILYLIFLCNFDIKCGIISINVFTIAHTLIFKD